MKIRDIAPFGLRIPAELKERIERAAAESGRSMNAEMIARLAGSFDATTLSEYKDAELLSELMRRFPSGKIEITISRPE